MGIKVKMHCIYSTLILLYSKLMLMEWGRTSTWLDQEDTGTWIASQACPLLPLGRVVMLVKSVNVTLKSLGPTPSSSFHLQNEQRGWLICCGRAAHFFDKAQRTGMAVFRADAHEDVCDTILSSLDTHDDKTVKLQYRNEKLVILDYHGSSIL